MSHAIVPDDGWRFLDLGDGILSGTKYMICVEGRLWTPDLSMEYPYELTDDCIIVGCGGDGIREQDIHFYIPTPMHNVRVTKQVKTGYFIESFFLETFFSFHESYLATFSTVDVVFFDGRIVSVSKFRIYRSSKLLEMNNGSIWSDSQKRIIEMYGANNDKLFDELTRMAR
jgi:hypothetical protein